jgi:hypothetical protein
MGPKEESMTELTQQQQQAIDASPEPGRLVDPRTNKTYVLVGADVYERITRLLTEDNGITMPQVALLMERAMREDDADDPTLAFYQQKYGNRQ